jgi:hypothetical protein
MSFYTFTKKGELLHPNWKLEIRMQNKSDYTLPSHGVAHAPTTSPWP